jgi:MFS family permease
VSPRTRTILLGLAVGVVLADSSIVTLALPDILRRFDVEIPVVARVLTLFNLALALAAVPAAWLARRSPVRIGAAGLVGFSVASIACALAPSFDALVSARIAQAVVGAAVIAAALELLVAEGGAAGSHAWTVAGIAGAAIGPAAGGILTQAFGWESIFVVQAPLTLVALPALRGVRPHPPPPSRPVVLPNVSLALISAALTAALFLLVLLLIEGWRLEPAGAALVVSVMPLAAIAAPRLPLGDALMRAATGAVLVAGGLTALAALPGARAIWTIPPQLLIGLGLGLALAALTRLALADGASGIAGGATIAARHAGVVVGLALLTPVFTADLDRNRDAALKAGTAILLDSRVPPGEKIALARQVLLRVTAAHGRLPDIDPPFEARQQTPELKRVHDGLQAQLDRAATHAFSRSFLISALLALLAVVPLARPLARRLR